LPSPQFWQALLAAECSAAKSRVLVEELGSLPDSEALSELSRHLLLTDAEQRRIASADMAALERAVKSGVQVLEAPDYPETLANAGGTPAGLFIAGEAACLDRPTVAIVGTRAASTYGKAVAHKFGEALGRAGVTVVSGGALGIDAAAHRGALDAGGSTVAVLATGVDNVYPRVHQHLFGQIQQSGCLVSQFSVGSSPSGYRFLQRNDVIAAMSMAVLVVEAPIRSGAMRTANSANELGREVFVVPANIDAFSFQGSFRLIRDGATLVSHPMELLESLGLEAVAEEPKPAPSGPGGQILGVLTVVPLAAELIVERTGMDTAEVLSELTMLELEGLVIRDGNGYAIRP